MSKKTSHMLSPQTGGTKGGQKILIVGTGALATLFAARFSKTGAKVTMLGTWQDALNALNRNGVRIIDADERENTYPVQAVSECEETALALVLVKSWQTERVAEQLTRCLKPNGLVITLQNGLGNGDVLASALGAERVAQGVITVGATLVAPGVVRFGGQGLVSLEADPCLGAFMALLTESGFQAEVVASAASLIWSKLLINTSINTLTALLDIPNGEVIKRPSARKLLGAIVQETAAVAAAQQIPLSFAEPVQAVEQIAERTASNFSSMLQDVRRGAPTEIDAICGAVVRAGKAHGVPTPLNEMLVALIRARVEG